MADKSVVQLEIQSLLDGKGFDETKKQLKTIGVDIKKTGEDGEFSLSKIDSSAKKTGGSFVELAAKITAAYMSVSKMINAYIDDAKANAKMKLALKNNTDEISRQGKSVSDLTNDFKDFASAQQVATGIGDEVTLSLMGTLTTLGVMPKDLKRVTAALQDMAAATGTSADSMARAWARLQEAPEEALGALSRVGVKIRKEMLEGMNAEQQRIFVLEKLEKAFGGQAKAMADATGGIAQANAAFGDFLEVLGKIVITVIGPLVKGLTMMFTWFNNLSSPLQVVIFGAIGLSAALITLRTAGITTFAALSTAVKGFFASLGPIGWATLALGTVATVLGAIGGKSNAIKDADEKIQSLSATIDSLTGAAKSAAAIDQLLQKLKNAKSGSEEYNRTVGEVLSTNESLKKSNITVANSYVDIANKVRDAYMNMNAASLQTALDDSDDLVSTLKSAWSEAQRLKVQPDPVSQAKYSAYLNTIASGMIQLKKMDELIFPGDPNNSQSFISRLSAEVTDLESRGDPLSWLTTDVLARYQKLMNARANAPAGSAYVQQGPSVLQGGGSQAIQEAVDVWQMRINLMDDEFEKRRQQTYKDYLAETANIERLTIDEKDKAAILDAVNKKYLTDRQKIESDYEDKLREERVRAYNEALSMMQHGLSLGTSLIKKDWKSAIGETLSMIPGVGQTLSGVFGTAVDFFGELFGSRSKTEAEKLGDWLEAAVQKFDQSFTRSETYSKLFGDLDLSAIEAEIDSISTALDESLAKIGLGAGTTRDQFKQYYDIIRGASFSGRNQSDYVFGAGPRDNIFESTILSVLGGPRGGGLNTTQMTAYVENIRKLFRDVYGDASDEMIKAFGLTGTDRQIVQQWFNVKNQLDGINGSIIAIAENTATWYDKLEESQLKKGLASTKDELDRINKKYEIGQITQEEMVKKSSEQIDNALEYLRALEPTQEVLDAIDDLLLQQINLQKQLNDESEKGLDIEDEKLRNLLAQREELERNIAAGYVREGTSDTVSQQAAILRQIIARAKEIGLSRDDYFQYEEALANLMSGFAGSSYTGKTGFGYTPGVEDFVGKMPIGSREFQTSMNTARASRSSTSNITTNTQNVTINGQAMLPNQEFVDGLRVLTKRVYGKDIIK